MLSLNQAKDLRDVLLDAEMKAAFEQFILKQRAAFVVRMVGALHSNNTEEAKRYAAQDEAYAELLPLLLHFAESELSAA